MHARKGRATGVLRNVLTAFALLICAAVVALMFRSSATRDVLSLPLGQFRAAWVETTHDGIQFVYRTSSRPENHGKGWSSVSQPEGVPMPTHLGFGYYHTHGWYIRDHSGTRLIGVTILTFPDYILILLSAIPPAIWALKRVPPENKCAHCGSAMPAGAIFCPTCKTPTA